MIENSNKKLNTDKERARRGQGFTPNNKLIRGGHYEMKSVTLKNGDIAFLTETDGLAGSIALEPLTSGGDIVGYILSYVALGGEFTGHGFTGDVIPILDETYSLGWDTAKGHPDDIAWEWVISNNPHVTSSDARKKRDIADLTYGLEDIKKLRPVSFKRVNKDLVQLGLIAQEAKEVIPEAVSGSEDTQYTMTYESLIPVLINAVKELSAEVESLKAKLA